MPNNLKFHIDNDEIEIVKDYKYLRIFFERSESYLTTRKYLQEKATMPCMAYCKSVESTNYLSSANFICLIKLFYQYSCIVQKSGFSKILILSK